jgi:hypothetical protein
MGRIRSQQLHLPLLWICHLDKSRYNNGLIVKLMLIWRREGRREMRA